MGRRRSQSSKFPVGFEERLTVFLNTTHFVVLVSLHLLSLCSLQTKFFVPPTKNHPDKKPTKQQATETKVAEEEDSKWGILDSCCFAPYKALFYPATKLAQMVASKLK